MNDENIPPHVAGQNLPAGQSQEWKLIEKIVLTAQDEQRRARRWGILFKSLGFSYLFVLLFLFVSSSSSTVSGGSADHVALIELNGVIAAGGDVDADNVVGGLRDAFKAKHARAVILRINSPGGSPVQAGIIYNEILRLRLENPDKKLYAVIADVGASGGYYIAAAADEIYADKASIVGSIGVIMNGFGAQELIKKLGIESRTMTAGENKAIMDPFAPVSAEHKKHVQDLLNTIHAQFIAAVRSGRGDRLKDDAAVFSGLFWTGEQAVEMGLADGLASAGGVARDIVGIETIVDYSYQRSPLERLAERFGARLGSSLGATAMSYSGHMGLNLR